MSREEIARLRRDSIIADPLSRVPGVGDVQHVRLAVRDAHLARPGQAHELAAHDAPTSVAAIKAQNVQVVGRADRRPARGAGPGAQRDDHRPTPPVDARAVPRRSCVRVNPDGSQLQARRRRARRAQLRELSYATSSTTASPAPAIGDPARARRERARHRERDPHDARPSWRRSIPPGFEAVLPARHDAVRAQVDRGRRAHAGRGDRARVPRDVPVPAELARDADPDASRCRSCCSARSACSRALGYSINTLTMFGMVLVDRPARRRRDRRRRERRARDGRRSSCRRRRRRASRCARSPARSIGIALVLAAVFVPMAFFGGSTGVIYRQFSITIVSAMTLSVLVALILTPALCATMLKPLRHEHHSHAARSAGSTAGSARRTRGYDARSSRSCCAGPRGCSRSTPS